MAKNPLELSKNINQPSHAIWVKNPKNEWKLWGGHDNGDIATLDAQAFKDKGYDDLRLVPNGENWDFNSRALNDELAKKLGHEIVRLPNDKNTYGENAGAIIFNRYLNNPKTGKRERGYVSRFSNEEELNKYLNDSDAQEKAVLEANDNASKGYLKDYYEGKLSLDELHDQLVKVHGNIKPAFEWLLKNTRR